MRFIQLFFSFHLLAYNRTIFLLDAVLQKIAILKKEVKFSVFAFGPPDILNLTSFICVLFSSFSLLIV